ncbi:MAG: hypothetical protein LBD42_06585 [Desulfovibrio sp.]|nr:hypothetical protein [Desulfovibrio sp.]
MDSFTGGIYSSDGEFIEDSLIRNRGKSAQIQKILEHLYGTYIYGGCLFGHFGHFIRRAVKPRTSGRGYKAHLNWNFCL